MKKIINNNPNGYPEIRNIFCRYNADFIYKKDIFHYGEKLAHKLTGKGYQPFWKGLFYNVKDQKTLCVFFNTINLGKNPWQVYFETTLPRLGNTPKFFYNHAIKQLTKDRCQEIVAISQCAYQMQVEYIKNEYPQYLDKIKEKMKVQLPPQKPLIESYSEKQFSIDSIVFTFVGADFFRKGGRELLQVFNELIPNHPQLKLNIISSLKYGDYATHTTKEDLVVAKVIIEKYPQNIVYYNSLANSDVLELLKQSHIGLLPTWADSFGYSVLESQAAGCPVITTNIRALPEVNNDEVGWVIPVSKKQNGDALIGSMLERQNFSVFLRKELKAKVLEIITSPEKIKEKGEKALEQIKLNYSNI